MDPWAKSGALPGFLNSVTGTQSYSFVYILSIVVFALQGQSCVTGLQSVNIYYLPLYRKSLPILSDH